MAIWKSSSARLVRDLSINILNHRFLKKSATRHTLGVSLPPATPRRVFSQQLAHAKAQRLQVIVTRYRRTVNRRMNLDTPDASAPVDMDIFLEEEATEMAIDLSEGVGELSATTPISPEATTPVFMAICVEDAAREEAGVDVSMSEAVSAVVEVVRDAEDEVMMLAEKALSPVEQVLRDADDDGSTLSESPSADLLPKMAVEDDVVSLVEEGTVAIKLYDELPSNFLYSQAKPIRSCRRGYHRYEPYPHLPSLRSQRRRRRNAKTKAPKNTNCTDCWDEKTLTVDEPVSSPFEEKSDVKMEPMVEQIASFDMAGSHRTHILPTIALPAEDLTSWYIPPVMPSIEESTLPHKPGPRLLAREEEDQDEWLNEQSDIYWERPFTFEVPSSPTLIKLEQGVEELRISPVVLKPEESTLPHKPGPRLLAREEENQDEWLNEQSDIYWERPFTPAVPSSPTIIPIERGMKRLKISSADVEIEKLPEELISRPIPVLPAQTPTPPTSTCTTSRTRQSFERGPSATGLYKAAVPIQTPPKALHRESCRDKENWSPLPLDLEAGVKVVPPRKRAPTLARSVFGTLRTWVGAGWGSL